MSKTKVPFVDSRVYMINDNPKIDYVQLCESTGLTSASNIRMVYQGPMHGRYFNERGQHQIYDGLRDFRPERDVLMISGRAFVNFATGVLLSNALENVSELMVMQYDAGDECYKIDRVKLPASRVFQP